MIRSDFSRLFELLAAANCIVESIDEAAAQRVRIGDVPSLVPAMFDLALLGDSPPQVTPMDNEKSLVPLIEAAPAAPVSLFKPLLE